MQNQERFITVNDSEGTDYPLEIYHYTSSEDAKVVIERGFSSKTMTMTPQDARKFAQAILDVTTEQVSKVVPVKPVREIERLDDLLKEADNEINYDGQPPNKINPVLVVLNRDDIASIGNHTYPNTIELKKTVTPVLAIATFGKREYVDDQGEECYEPTVNYHQRLHNGLAYRIMLAMKMLIGSMGIYPFKKIFFRTVPQCWTQDDISDKPGFNT